MKQDSFRNSHINLFLTISLFFISVATRVSLVDTTYQYSFEPDSEPCVAETRSFYFFFSHPAKGTLPHVLMSYPNYSDGDFIASALVANVVRPLVKAGIIQAPVCDNDNSIIIFSMRWSGALFDALAMVFVFLTLLLLTQNRLLSFGICLLYYLLNPQTLFVDLIRIDHYSLFAAGFIMYASISLFHSPAKKRFYVLCGIGIGLVSATKINFPFYLVVLPVALFFLWRNEKLQLRGFVILTIAGLIAFTCMYFRWLLYSENIYSVISDTLNVGHEWFGFWGNNNYLFYVWQQFYNHGPSLSITLLLLIFYSSFLYCVIVAIVKKDALKGILCITFIIKMLSLMLSPKIGRYGMIIPFWISIFVALGLNPFIKLFSHRQFVTTLTLLLLVPSFLYALHDFDSRATECRNIKVSIIKTRINPYTWIKNNIEPGSIIAIQHPHVSNPPVFDLPYIFTEDFLDFPFLDKSSFSKFYPDLERLKKNANYVILSDKEVNYHLYLLHQYQCDPALIDNWKQFYTSLKTMFPYQCFTSDYDNYGVGNICIYKINYELPPVQMPRLLTADSLGGGKVFLRWSYNISTLAKGPDFQVDISDDSLLRWLVYGSQDGYQSKYRKSDYPAMKSAQTISYIPDKINKAVDNGLFDRMLGKKAKDLKDVINTFFGNFLITMKNSNLTFKEALAQKLGARDTAIYNTIDSLYKSDGDILNAHLAEYIKISGLKFKDESAIYQSSNIATWQYEPPVKLTHGKRYFWRVRIKRLDQALSDWSEVQSFVP